LVSRTKICDLSDGADVVCVSVFAFERVNPPPRLGRLERLPLDEGDGAPERSDLAGLVNGLLSPGPIRAIDGGRIGLGVDLKTGNEGSES